MLQIRKRFEEHQYCFSDIYAVFKKLIIGKDKLMTDEMQMADICI